MAPSKEPVNGTQKMALSKEPVSGTKKTSASKEPVTKRDVKEFMLLKLQAAKQKVNHIPYIVSNHRKMAVWSDVKEILFMSCLNPKCTVVLNALKHRLDFPASETYMHPCTQTEQLLFLRQFIIVAPGTLLVDVSCLRNSETLMKLHDMVSVKHQKSKETNTQQCNHMAKLKDRDSVCLGNNKAQQLKILGKRKFLPAVIRDGPTSIINCNVKTTSVDSKAEKDVGLVERAGGADRPGRICQKTELFPLISTVLCSQDDKQAEKALVPLALLKEAFPEYLSVLEEVAHTYVRQCAKDVSCVTQCLGEEGQRLTAFLTLYKGTEKHWFCQTSLSLMMSWAEFWKCCRCESSKKRDISRSVSVCVLTGQKQTAGVLKLDQGKDLLKEQMDRKQDSHSLSDQLDDLENATSRSDFGSKSVPPETSSDTKVRKSLQKIGKVPSSKTAVFNLTKQSQESKCKLKESLSEGSLFKVHVNRTAAKLLNNSSAQKLSGKIGVVADKIKKRQVGRETTGKPIQSKSDTGKFVGSKAINDVSAQTTARRLVQFEKDKEKSVNLSQKIETNTDGGRKKHIKSNDHVINNKAGKFQRKNESQNTKNSASGEYHFSKNDPADLRKTHVEVQKIKKPYNSKMKPETKLIKSLKQENTGNPAVQVVSELKSLMNEMQNTLILSDQMRPADKISPVSITSENKINNIQVDSSALKGKTITPAEVKTNNYSIQNTTLLGQMDRNSNAKLKENIETESKVSTEEKEVQNFSVSVGKAKENANRFQFKEYLEASYENAVQIPQQRVTKEQTDSQQTDFEGASESLLFNSKKTKLNRDSDDEVGRTELCSGHMSSPSTDIKLNPQLHIRPSTAEARKPRAPASGSIGNKKCKSAVTRVTQNGIVPAAYYSSPRPNLMLKTSHMNTVPVASAGQHNVKSSNCQDIPNPESVTKATQSSAGNKVNILPAEKQLQHRTSKGYKVITESSHDEVIKKWKLMNKSKLNTNVVNGEKLVKEGNHSRGTEQKSDDKTAESAVLKRNGSPRVTPAVLHRVKQLQEQFGDMQLHKKESGINGHKAVINKQYLNAKSVKDKDKVVDNKQSTKGHDYIVVPYGAFQASVNATKPKQMDEGCIYPNSDVQTSKSPSFGSSTSCSPDIYDGYARKTKHKPNRADPPQGKKGNPNNITVKDKKSLNIKVGQKRGAENSYVKYVHSNSPDELHKPNLPFNSCDRLFKDLIALCEKNYSKYESTTSEPEHTSSCSHCALCQAEAIYSPEDQILNQLAYHMLERMKSLKINCVAENAENSFSALDKPVMSVALMSRSGSRNSEKAVAQDDSNSTISRKISLLDKVSSFAEKSFDEEEEHLKETSQRETKDSQSHVEETLAETRLNETNQNQVEAPSEFQLKVKDFFVPIDQPIYYRVSDKGPFIPVKESFHIPENTELYYRDTMQKTPDPCTEQGDTELEVKNSSDVSVSTDPDALEGSEIVKSYQDNPRLYGQSSKPGKQEKRKQDLADRVCSPTNINLKLNLKEKTNVGLVNSAVCLRNVVETNVGIPSEKAKQCMDCQLSASKSALQNIGIKPVKDESVIARNKTNETVTAKSDVNLELHDDKLSGCTNMSLKPRPKSSARCGKRFKTNPAPSAKDYVLSTHDSNSGLSDIFRITAAETHMHISADKNKEEKQSQEPNKEEKQSQEPISLRQRSSKSAKTADKRTDNQAQERGRRFAERQKRQGSSGVLAAVSSIARNTFESIPQEGTSSVKFQNRQNKLRKHIQTKMKNKNKAIRNRKVKSAPQRNYGPDLSRVSGEDNATDLSQVNVNTQPTPTDYEQSDNTKTAKFERSKKHVRSAKLKASHCKRKAKASPTDKDDKVITSCGVNCSSDDEALEESNNINANLNNNVCDTLNMAGRGLNRNDVSKETEHMKVVRSKLPKRKKKKCKKSTDDMSDAEQETAEIEIDVDEVFDWEQLEQQYDNSTDSVDEITFTITHVDGTQLIVSNKHPDFENIVKFIEEQKRNCGDESITVEAELNCSPKESVEENIHGASTLSVKPEADVQQTLDEGENYVEMTKLVNKDKCSLDEIEICPFMPLQNIDDINGKEKETYSICDTFRDNIPAELIIQCFMNEEGDMKEMSSFNGKDYKHHDNIFEALAPGIWSSVESPNSLGRKEKDVGDSFRNKHDKAVSSYSDVKANESISELPSCKKKSLIETESQIDSYKNPVIIITNRDNDKGLAEKEEGYGLSPQTLNTNLEVQYKMQDHQITSKTSYQRTGSIETLVAANNKSSLINELPVTRLMISENEAKPHTKVENDEQIHTISADELNKLSDTSELLSDLHNIYPEVRCSELSCNLDNKSEIDVRSENVAITTLEVATAKEQQQSLNNKMPSLNDNARLILERGNYLNSVDDNSNSDTGMNQNIHELGLNEYVESSAELDNINCDQDRFSGSDDIQSDQEKLATIKTDQQVQKQKWRKRNKQTGESLNVMLKDIMKNDTDRAEKQYFTQGTDSAKKNASVTSSNEVRGYLSKKKSVKPEHEEEDEEEEEKRREKEEQIAAEGFIKTQQKYMEIILNNSLEIQKEEGRTVDCKSVTPRSRSPRASGFPVENLPEGMPVHGDRQCYKTNVSTSNTSTADSNDDDNDEGIWIEDASNSCRYQLIDDEEGMNLGGLAFFSDWVFPYVYINGYKFTPLREALQCFRHCQPACTIPRSVLNQHKGLVKSLSTWDQVYRLELIMMKTGYTLKTGDMLVKLDSLLSLLPELTKEVVARHRNTKLKRSQNCNVTLYGVKV